MIDKQKIYVAGPYTRGDVMRNIRYAIEAGDELLQYGLVPFVPHLTGFWHIMFPHEYGTWMEYDSEWLKSCDALLRIDGDSDGADFEVRMAKKLGIPIFYSTSDVLTYFVLENK